MGKRKPPFKQEEIDEMHVFIRKIRVSWWRWGFVIDYLVVALLLIGLWQIIGFKDACEKCTDIQIAKCPEFYNRNLTIPFSNSTDKLTLTPTLFAYMSPIDSLIKKYNINTGINKNII